ncbi:RNA polymerase sigma-70 factor (ECF subfamily) [Anaerosolibacter carboniphilus]|uniref:RNA polymerase sigma factor n=1 Tax=Anaerosolibacter carboniphilus TaxID=1417629 RepID=A0A841KZV9_9FIRM|nr:RNA polymerase sigma factor [Anaerosolibacter carboniphilus]MBB6218843.1 RNA polymerase sigma-70 factor (ECF subfamily) [Anaerosolibacter carboniphilus]
MQFTDENLIQLCKKNKREGYDLLFEKYEKYIYRLCYYYTHSKEDSLDLLQEVYIRIYKGIHNFDENRPLLPWLKTITVNVCLNHIRHQKAKMQSMHVSMDDECHSLTDLIASAANVEAEIAYLDTKQFLAQGIQELPEDMRTAVILRHVEGMSYNQIGEIMALPIGTVKTYLFRGRKILKAKLKNAGVWEV